MNLVVLGQTVWALVEGPQNWASCGLTPLGWGVPDRLQTSRTRTWVTVPNFIAIDQTVRVYVCRNPPENGFLVSRLSGPLKVFGSDTVLIPQQPWHYIVSFPKYSEILAEACKCFLPHSYLPLRRGAKGP